MPLRKLTGGVVAASAWLMPDGTTVSVKLTQKVYDEAVRAMEVGDWLAANGYAPDPKARCVAWNGGIPALDTADGFPEPGDCWPVDTIDDDTGKRSTVLHVQTGDDPMGSWFVRRTKQILDANGKLTFDANGVEIREVLLDVGNTHRVICTVYDQSDPCATASAVMAQKAE